MLIVGPIQSTNRFDVLGRAEPWVVLLSPRMICLLQVCCLRLWQERGGLLFQDLKTIAQVILFKGKQRTVVDLLRWLYCRARSDALQLVVVCLALSSDLPSFL